jgi:hypothetical protein
MSAITLDAFRSNNTIEAEKFRGMVRNKLLFKLFMLKSLPMGFIAGLKVHEFTADKCSISVPYKWLNQNPFSSTYFAVLAMAAEMSTGMAGMMHTTNAKPSIAILVVGLEAEFVKKATGLTIFTCEDSNKILSTIEDAIASGEGRTVKCVSTGRSESGDVIAKFNVTWSFKARNR